jgi:hypothetical protein
MCPKGSSSDERVTAKVERLDVSTFVVPTDHHESDGTLEWDATTMVVVEATAGGSQGIGRLVHLEYFYDHQRIERMLFEGT